MNLSLQATNLTITPSLKTYIENTTRSLQKLFKHEGGADLAVEIGRSSQHHKKGDVFFAEFNMAAGKQVLRSRVETTSVHAAIDEAKDEFRRELLKFKGKKESMFLRGARIASKNLRLSKWAMKWRGDRNDFI